MPYGVTDSTWKMLPADDKARIIADFNNGQAGAFGPTVTPSPGQLPQQPSNNGGGGSGDPKLPPLDWAASFFASLGLPPDVVGQVNQIFAQYSDVNAASAAALGYIRGTPWYTQTFPGIQAAIQKGLVSNEADYRSLLNQQTQIYKQYLGRDITSSEFAANLGEGAPLATIGGRLQGAALAGTYGNDWRYTLGAFDTAPTGAEVTALGQESAGLDSVLGQQVKRRLDLAQQRLAGVFKGTLATPGLSLNNNGRLSAPGLGSQAPDVGA